MPADTLEQNFLCYLTCDLPLGYPSKTPVPVLLLPGQQSISRRELLHQQAAFLDFARQFLDAQPWLSYLAAIKHEAVLIAIPTFAAQLVDVVDILFFSELQQKCKELREASHAVIDQETAGDCERLVQLQVEAAYIEDARKNLSGAIQAGFTAVDPLPRPVQEPAMRTDSLRTYILGVISFLVLGALIPTIYGGMLWSLVGLIVIGILARQEFKKEKAVVDSKSVEFKAYMRHESYHKLCRRSVALVLSLPFEIRKSALRDLPQGLAGLEALPPERDSLEARYIRPFFAEKNKEESSD